MVFLKAVAITVNLKGHGHSETTRLRKVVLIRFSCCPRIFATSSKSNSIPSARVFYREKNQTKSDVPLLLQCTLAFIGATWYSVKYSFEDSFDT